MTAPTPDQWRETVAEVLSWATGEMTRYRPEAHPDHNRWSWRGDGHGERLRDEFRDAADALLAPGGAVARIVAEARAAALREAADAVKALTEAGDLVNEPWDNGYRCAVRDALVDLRRIGDAAAQPEAP